MPNAGWTRGIRFLCKGHRSRVHRVRSTHELPNFIHLVHDGRDLIRSQLFGHVDGLAQIVDGE